MILAIGDAGEFLEFLIGPELRSWFGATHRVSGMTLKEAERWLEHFDADAPLSLCVADASRNSAIVFEFMACLGKVCPLVPRAVVIEARQKEAAAEALQRGDIDRYIIRTCGFDEVKRALAGLLARHKAVKALQAAIKGRVGSHVFITGATGYLGIRMVQELLRCSDARVTCLTRGSGDTPFDQRLPVVAEDYPGRLEFVEGDMGEPNMGLDDGQLRRLEKTVDEIWHLAAITSFKESLREQVMRVNLEGTQCILDFARRCSRLRCFNYVSTAYVAGCQPLPHVSREELLPEPPRFKNPYEESKWRAEHIVGASGVPYLIFRPSILIGESYSGRCDGKTIYGAAKIAHIARYLACGQCSSCSEGKAHFRMSGAPGASLNLLPVDWAVDQFLRLRAGSQPDGSVFHCVHTAPVCVEDIMAGIAEALEITGWEFIPDLQAENLCWAEAIMLKGLMVFREYMTFDDPVFDRAKSRATLGSVELPPLDADFLKFCIRSFYDQSAEAWIATLAKPAESELAVSS